MDFNTVVGDVLGGMVDKVVAKEEKRLKRNAADKVYRESAAGRLSTKKRKAKYRASVKGKQKAKEYNQKPEVKAKKAAYKKTEAGKAASKRGCDKYRASEKGKAKIIAQRETKGYAISQDKYNKGKGIKTRATYMDERGGREVRQAYSDSGRRAEVQRDCYARNVNYRLTKNGRSAIYNALKRQNNGKNVGDDIDVTKLLGCSIDEFREYIEAQFVEGMSWDNQGIQKQGGEKKWHMDHIKPCSSFDLSDPKQRLECFNYRNHQPLWASENFSKGSKIMD